MASSSALQVNNDTELIDLGKGRFKFINCYFDKPHQKMFDYSTDLKVKVGNKIYHTHREVLTNASGYFSAMFSVDMQEREQNIVELKYTSEVGFSHILDYFYHGHLTMDDQTIGDILEAARFFQVEWLVSACTIYMVQCLSFGDYAGALELADLFGLGDISEAAFDFLGLKFNILLERGDAAKLCFEVLLDLLCSDAFVAVSESELFTYLMQNWRQQEGFSDLLASLRYGLLQVEDLKEIQTEGLASGDISERVDNALEYVNYPLSAPDLTDREFLVRGSRPCLVVFSTNADITVLKVVRLDTLTVFMYTLDMSPLGSYLENCSSCKVGNFLALAGGYDHGYTSSNKLVFFDTKDCGLVHVERMHQGRVNFGLCSGGERLFAVGGVYHAIIDGIDTEEVLASVEVFLLRENRWIDLPHLPKPVFDMAVVWHDGYLYISGGVSTVLEDPLPLPDFRRLKDGESQWEEVAPLNHSRQYHSMLAWGGQIYVFGGATVDEEDGLTVVPCLHNEVFSLESMSWTDITASPAEFGRVYDKWTLVDDSLLYICAGHEESKVLRVFDLEKNEWCSGLEEDIGDECSHVTLLNVAVHE